MVESGRLAGSLRMSTRPPLFRRIAYDLAEQIASGRLGPGDRLPSTRALAERYDAAMRTATRAVGLLHDAGLVEGDPGRGVFVADGAAELARRFHSDG